MCLSLLKKIQNDAFLKKHVVGIHQHEDKSIDLKFRLNDFIVQLGSLSVLDKKSKITLKPFIKKQ